MASSDQRNLKIVLDLFHETAQRVPAYKAFLKEHTIDPKKIVDLETLQTVPPVNKKNYLKKYPIKDLLLDGDTRDARIISMSSGSSGEPFYWFRGKQSVDESVLILDDLLAQSFQTKEKETLCIMAFAMGTWIAGTYMIDAMNGLADTGHRITCITPGIHKDEIIRILKKMGKEFEQILLMGYPPFIKDVIDAALGEKLKLKEYNLRLLFAGENISEPWRGYVLERIGHSEALDRTIAMYGTADAGIIGTESPLSIYLRRIIHSDPELMTELFPDITLLPTLVHFEPSVRYAEQVNGHIVFSAANTLPLVRYDIMDEGRVMPAQALIEIIEAKGHTVPKALLRWADRPFIALYGRPDVAATFYALNIYPENIKYGLEDAHLLKYLTGKFILETQFDEQTQEQTLHLYVELHKGAKRRPTLENQVLAAVRASLKKNNSEFNKLSQELHEKSDPIIHLIPCGDPRFDIKIKMKWIAKS
jgi:phenylacetate-CoA ligase